MSDIASELSVPSQPAPPADTTAAARDRLRSIGANVMQGVCIVVGAVSIAWLIRLLFDRDPVRAHWTLQFMLALAATMATCWGSIQRRRLWSTPMRELLALLEQVRRGEAPIEELSGVRAGMRDIIPVLQQLLHEVRRQKSENQTLQAEMRQRVAHRTDALERMNAALRTQATHDALTGLCNRRMLDEYLPKVVDECTASRSALSLLMIDVDNFKSLNDTLGHAVGDDLLRAIGQIIRSTIRGNDLAFRCGGDEFVILLPEVSVKGAQALIGRLESLVDALAKTYKVPRKPRLSIGMSRFDEQARITPQELMESADKALYRLKSERKGLLQPPAVSLQSSASN